MCAIPKISRRRCGKENIIIGYMRRGNSVQSGKNRNDQPINFHVTFTNPNIFWNIYTLMSCRKTSLHLIKTQLGCRMMGSLLMPKFLLFFCSFNEENFVLLIEKKDSISIKVPQSISLSFPWLDSLPIQLSLTISLKTTSLEIDRKMLAFLWISMWRTSYVCCSAV